MELAAGTPGDGAEVYSEAIATKPRDRVREKEALTVFTPWHLPDAGEEELGEVTEMGEIPEPGADRFRAALNSPSP